MLFKKIKRYSAYFLCLALVLGSALPTVLWTAAEESVNPLITSFEEADTVQELKDKNIIDYSHNITVNTDETFVSDGANSILYRPKKADGTDYDTKLDVNFNDSVKNAYGITFKVYNADEKNSAQMTLFLMSGSQHKYQCSFTAVKGGGWQTVTVEFENVGSCGDLVNDFSGGSYSGNRIPYDDICGLTGILIRMPYIGKDHSGVYFDDFRYIFKEESEDITTVEKTLVSFDGCEIGKVGTVDNPLPEGVSVASTYTGTQSVAEDQDGNKLYTVALDKKVKVTSTSTNISARGDYYIALEVNVPERYAPYLDSISVDIKNNTPKPSGTKNNLKTYYVIGVTDNNGSYGKRASSSDELAYDYDGIKTENLADMRRIDGKTTFLSTAKTTDKWNQRQFAEIKQILIYIALPNYTVNRADDYSVSIGDISVTLKGDRQELESIDEIDTQLEDFDSAASLDEIVSKGTVALDNGKGKFTLSDDAYSGDNALLYKSETDETNYNTSLSVSLAKRAEGCVGIEFYVKNLDQSTGVNIRCHFITTVGGTSKRYQFIKTVNASEDSEYIRIRILFNDVGSGGDEIWGGTTSGESMTSAEIAGLTTMRIRLPYVKSTHAGILFDSFRLLTEDDIPKPEELVRRVLDFDDCEAGGALPEQLAVTDKYGGSMGVTETEDGGKAYRINYDLETTLSTGNQIGTRSYVLFSITVPKTALKGATEIKVGMTNNAINCDNTWSGTTNIYQVVGIRGGGYYGKTAENADKVPNVGGLTEVRFALDKMRRTTGGLTGWCGTTTYWTAAQLEDVVSILVYITAPTCDGTEGWSFDLNYVDVYYEDAAQNYEIGTRSAVKADRLSGEENSYISAEQVAISKKDPNFTMFNTAWRLNISSDKDPQPLKFVNTYTNYYSDLTQFTDTATLAFYLQADVPLDLQITLRDKAGEALQITEPTAPPEIASQYGVYQLAFKDILDEYYEENPEGAFNIADIRYIEVLPVAKEDGLPATVMLSGLAIWTKEVGTAVVYSGYHYSDKGVTVDAYNDYLPLDTKTVVETEDAATAVKNFDIKLPAELTPISFTTVTFYTAADSVTNPSGKVWLSFDVDSSLDLSEISLYKVYFDGSYVKQRYAVEDGAIALSTFEAGSFLITKGKLKEKTEDNTDTSGNTNTSDNTINNGNQGDTADMTYTNNTDNNGDGATAETVIQKKVIRKVVRKKQNNNDSGLPVWAIVLIAAGSAVAVVGAAVTTVIIVKRRKKGGLA